MIRNVDLITKQKNKFVKLGYNCKLEKTNSDGFTLSISPRVPVITNWNVFKKSLENTYIDLYKYIEVKKLSDCDEDYSYNVRYTFKDAPKITYKKLIIDKLNTLEIGHKFPVSDFLNDYWNASDYFARRSFDVFFNQAKKAINEEKPEKIFRCISGYIYRLE